MNTLAAEVLHSRNFAVFLSKMTSHSSFRLCSSIWRTRIWEIWSYLLLARMKFLNIFRSNKIWRCKEGQLDASYVKAIYHWRLIRLICRTWVGRNSIKRHSQTFLTETRKLYANLLWNFLHQLGQYPICHRLRTFAIFTWVRTRSSKTFTWCSVTGMRH